MNPESVQKVLDFIREGAKAASGPASEAFKQVCAYRAYAALSDLIAATLFWILSLVAFVLTARWAKRTWGEQYEDKNILLGVCVGICAVTVIFSTGFLIDAIRTDIPIIHNPAGAVLNQFVSR